jgi:hypothetical protein
MMIGATKYTSAVSNDFSLEKSMDLHIFKGHIYSAIDIIPPYWVTATYIQRYIMMCLTKTDLKVPVDASTATAVYDYLIDCNIV